MIATSDPYVLALRRHINPDTIENYVVALETALAYDDFVTRGILSSASRELSIAISNAEGALTALRRKREALTEGSK